MKNTILVTGFEPFGGEVINPSYEVVKRMKDKIGNCQIHKIQIPTAFNLSSKKVIKYINEIKPRAVLSIGQAGGRCSIAVERVAININDASIPDNNDKQPIDEIIAPDGPVAYFSTLPIKAIVERIKRDKIPAAVSNSAGTYVCNHVMYQALHYIACHSLPIKSGFIHIPYSMEQVIEKNNTPSLPLQVMVEGIEKAVEEISYSLEDK